LYITYKLASLQASSRQVAIRRVAQVILDRRTACMSWAMKTSVMLCILMLGISPKYTKYKKYWKGL
jgi:hypothetical protein